MTQIAHARLFNGTSDELQYTLGGLAGAWGATTVAAIAKPDSTGTGSGAVFGIQSTLDMSMHLDNAVQDFYDYSTFQSWSSGSIALDVWSLIAWTKTTGSVNPRRHTYHYSNAQWDHTEYLSAQPNLSSSSTPVRMGTNQFGGWFKGLIAVVGVWKGTALSDANLEKLPWSIVHWRALAPSALWMLNQSDVTTAVSDLVGTAHQSSRTGTTAQAISDLDFDVDNVIVNMAVNL